MSSSETRATTMPEETQAVPATDNAATQLSSAGNVEKIRDILFGGQMRDYERRFSRLEELIQRESAAQRDETRKRLDNLDEFVRKEVASLSDRLKTERGERSDAQERLSQELKNLGESMSRKISDLDEHRAEDERSLRQDILQKSKDLLDTIENRHNSLSETLDRRVEELRTAKTDRAALAEMLTEVALRLNDEFHIPSGEG